MMNFFNLQWLSEFISSRTGQRLLWLLVIIATIIFLFGCNKISPESSSTENAYNPRGVYASEKKDTGIVSSNLLAKGEEDILEVSAETSAALHIALHKEDGIHIDSISEDTYNQLIWTIYEVTSDEESASVEKLFEFKEEKGNKWYYLRPGKTWFGPNDIIDKD